MNELWWLVEKQLQLMGDLIERQNRELVNKDAIILKMMRTYPNKAMRPVFDSEEQEQQYMELAALARGVKDMGN